jgi:hypothetical protein
MRTTCWVVRDDAGLEAGLAGRMVHEAAAADVLLRGASSRKRRGGILPHHAEQFGAARQRGEIAGDVRRAAGHEALALEIHHGHGRFRRDAATLPQMN